MHRLPRLVAVLLHRRPTVCKLLIRHSEMDRAVGDIDLDAVTILDERDRTALGRFWGKMTDREAR